MTEILSLADLRPGDIGIMRMGGIVPGFFPVRLGQMLCRESYVIGGYSADHVLICVEADSFLPTRAVQAMPRGAEEIALTLAKHWNSGVRWFRLPEDYAGQAEDAAAIARLFVSEKVPYSFLSYLALAAWSRGLKVERLEKWINRRNYKPNLAASLSPARMVDLASQGLPVEAICSVLVDQAWSLAGKRVMEGVKRQCVTPGAMAIQLSEMSDVIVGKP